MKSGFAKEFFRSVWTIGTSFLRVFLELIGLLDERLRGSSSISVRLSIVLSLLLKVFRLLRFRLSDFLCEDFRFLLILCWRFWLILWLRFFDEERGDSLCEFVPCEVVSSVLGLGQIQIWKGERIITNFKETLLDRVSFVDIFK